jgi:hypothetical protein
LFVVCFNYNSSINLNMEQPIYANMQAGNLCSTIGVSYGGIDLRTAPGIADDDVAGCESGHKGQLVTTSLAPSALFKLESLPHELRDKIYSYLGLSIRLREHKFSGIKVTCRHLLRWSKDDVNPDDPSSIRLRFAGSEDKFAMGSFSEIMRVSRLFAAEILETITKDAVAVVQPSTEL